MPTQPPDVSPVTPVIERTAPVHWTQTPEGRKRMAAISRNSAAQRLKTMKKKRKKGGIFQYLTPAQQKVHLKKMQAGRKRQQIADQRRTAKAARQQAKTKAEREPTSRHRQAVETFVNGRFTGERYAGTTFPSGLKKYARGIAKDSIRAFAIAGAKLRLQQLEEERDVLIMFIGQEPV
jgi:hypothetical protein